MSKGAQPPVRERRPAEGAGAPVHLGQAVEVEVTDLAHDGAGVARLPGGGYVLFIPGALPGERVEAQVAAVQPRSGRGRLLRVVEASPDRIPLSEAVCGVAERCGGCSPGHLAYPAQLAFKTRRVTEALRRIGGLSEVPVAPCLPAPQTEGYRNKLQYVVFGDPAGGVEGEGIRLRLGQLAPGTHDPVPAEDCRLAAPRLRKTAREVADALTRWACSLPETADRRPPWPHHVVLRLASATEEVMLVLVTRTADFPHWEELAGDILARVAQVKSVVQLANSRPVGTVLAGRRVRVAGRSYLVERLGPLTLHLSPESFLQVNPAQTLALYELVRRFAALQGTEEVLDVYCGIGTIALYLAPGARHVTGIEVIPAAVEDAAATARLNGLANAEFQAGPAERLVPELASRGYQPEVVVLDPPRAGVAPAALSAVAALRPARLVYVSCNPETLARDLRRVVDAGYAVQEVQPVDMFPQTSHTEAVALVTRE